MTGMRSSPARLRRRLPVRRLRCPHHAGAGAQRQRSRRALDPYRPRRVPGLAAAHWTQARGAGAPSLRRPLQRPSSAPSAWAGTAGSTSRSNRHQQGSKARASPRPPWRAARRVPPASCMNGFLPPTGVAGRARPSAARRCGLAEGQAESVLLAAVTAQRLDREGWQGEDGVAGRGLERPDRPRPAAARTRPRSTACSRARVPPAAQRAKWWWTVRQWG